MIGFFKVAEAVRVINQYFQEEAQEQDFWEVDKAIHPNLAEEEGRCFTIDLKKLKKKYSENPELIIVDEEGKASLLEAFQLLRNVSSTLPEDASLSERLLFAKGCFPAVLFRTDEAQAEQTDPGEVIPLFKENPENDAPRDGTP